MGLEWTAIVTGKPLVQVAGQQHVEVLISDRGTRTTTQPAGSRGAICLVREWPQVVLPPAWAQPTLGQDPLSHASPDGRGSGYTKN